MHLLSQHVSGANSVHSHYDVSFPDLPMSMYAQNSVSCVFAEFVCSLCSENPKIRRPLRNRGSRAGVCARDH